MKIFLRKTLCILSGMLLLCAAAWGQYDKDVFSFRGRTALQEGRLQDALAQFNILARLDSTDYYTFFYRGITKYNLGDVRGARADFSTAIRLNPVFTSAYHYRAISQSRSGNYESALQDLQKAISLRPGSMGLYFTRGVTYFLSRQFPAAVSDFDRYIRKEPKDPAAYLNRGAAYLFMADTTRALADYNKAIRLDRFEPEGYLRRGALNASRKDFESAMQDYDKAIELDSTMTLAYFQRALVLAETGHLKEAMADLDKVLEREPGNALTLYNRSLLSAQAGDYEAALADMDRVIFINPGNVLAYFNRAGFFAGMERWDDALADYNKAIELYPDFAKAYMNRSWVELQLGMKRASKEDYRTAQRKVQEYRSSGTAFADTSAAFSRLLALDADFARSGFENEMLRHRDVDIKLKPLFHFVPAAGEEQLSYALNRRYENRLVERFLQTLPAPAAIGTEVPQDIDIPDGKASGAQEDFADGLRELSRKQYASALQSFSRAVDAPAQADDPYSAYYKAFYLMNRGALRAQMIDFIASFESNVQTLTMDEGRSTRARVSESVTREYDYSEALEDMEAAARILPSFPYIQFNLGNLYVLSSRYVEALSGYDKALELYPYLAEAYFNRALVLIYLKDKEKGCIDLSRAGELGIEEAYPAITRYCVKEERP